MYFFYIILGTALLVTNIALTQLDLLLLFHRIFYVGLMNNKWHKIFIDFRSKGIQRGYFSPNLVNISAQMS